MSRLSVFGKLSPRRLAESYLC